MNYLMTIVGTTQHDESGAMPAEALEAMNRAFPEWRARVGARRVVSRELDLPGNASVVRVRGDETLVVDGPFAESKEFMAGMTVLDCADLDDALEVASTSPVAWHHRMEVRPFPAGIRLTERVEAFGRGEGSPYLLLSWMSVADAALQAACDDWRDDLVARDLYILGNTLGGADSATTVSARDGRTHLVDGPFTETPEFIAAIDVVGCDDRDEAIRLAATHPVARTHAVEVRPFYSE
ncbi:MAG TPA: YciI family protein [Micromonosporaceae bacterium]|jgi:hypothetical protein